MKKIIEVLGRIWFALFIIICLLVLAARFAYGQDTEIKEAKYLVETDRSQKAIANLSAATNAYPSTASILYYLGMAQLKEGQRSQALKSFDKGIQVDEKEPLNYAGRGYLSILENNPQKAKLDFDRALSLSKSKNVSVLQAVGEACIEGKLTTEALGHLSKAQVLDDHDPTTLILLGDAYLQQNNGGQAVTSYEKAAVLDGHKAQPHYKIGLVYLRSRNFKAAEESFAKAIAIDPGYTLAYKELGELYYQLKQGDKAVSNYEKYLSLTGSPEEGQLRYAFLLFMAKDYTKANGIFRLLAEKADVTPITLRFYARSLFEAGDYTQSRKIFEQYFSKVTPTEIEAADYGSYGKLLLKQNEDSLAAENLQKSLSIERKQPDLVQLLAETYFKSKKYADAIASYEQLLLLRSKPSPQDYYSLGRAYYLNEHYEKADTIFQKLIEMQPNMSVGYLWEARAKSNLDPESEQGLAKPFYEKVIEKTSATPDKYKNDLVEAYAYLGYYHFLKHELPLSKSYWQKVITLNPDDLKARQALKALN